MKTLKTIPVLIACAFLTVGGCASTKTWATPQNAQITTAFLCSGVLQQFSESKRHEAANWMFAVAHGIRTFEGGRIPTPAELKATIKLFTPDSEKWDGLAQIIFTAWAAVYPQIGGDTKKALIWLEALAAGVEQAAMPYVNPGVYGTPIQAPTASPVPGPDFSPQPE